MRLLSRSALSIRFILLPFFERLSFSQSSESLNLVHTSAFFAFCFCCPLLHLAALAPLKERHTKTIRSVTFFIKIFLYKIQKNVKTKVAIIFYGYICEDFAFPIVPPKLLFFFFAVAVHSYLCLPSGGQGDLYLNSPGLI